MTVQERALPQPRKYATRAQQQAAYRNRRAGAERELLAQKGLPPLPAIPTLPGHARWRAIIAQAHQLLSLAVEEMQRYHDDRSEPWQDSARAEELLTKLEHLQEALDQLESIE